ncbi:MAG: LD-carboxypeptidase [Opitutales bacterium]|nr:LD-carboxypeptidase [Opitutales bacterium]
MNKPAALKIGDTIRLVAPSSPPNDRSALENAIFAFETLGYNVKYSDVIFSRSGYLAGTDEERARDFEDAFADEKTDAILCVRGGYGSTRLLELIDWESIEQSKVFMGFSDITALSCALWKHCKMPSFSGPVLMSDLVENRPDEVSWGHAMPLLTGEKKNGALIAEPFNLSYPLSIVGGESYGRLMGGNLSLICSLMGTRFFPDFSRSILFLEDVGEGPYRIDRYLTQLMNAGVLESVAGIVLGDFRYSDAQRKNDKQQGLQTMEEVFEERLGGLGVPVLMNVPFGHIKPKLTIPFGALVILDCEKRNILLQESSVE